MKKLIAFDLDDTLAVTKSPVSDRMAALLGRLLEKYDVCVITGGDFKQIQKQVTSRLVVRAIIVSTRTQASGSCSMLRI